MSEVNCLPSGDQYEPFERIYQWRGNDPVCADAMRLGENALKEGRVAAVLLAGGMASRLGCEFPKGMYPIGFNGESLFEIFADKIHELQKKYGRFVPLYVMTSDATDEQTCKFFQDQTTIWLTGTTTPEQQLSETHYLMLGMNGATWGGHSVEDVEYSSSFDTLAQRRQANLERAWERLTSRSLAENAKFFAVKAYKAYADGSFASHSSFLELETPKRTDSLSLFLRSLYHKRGALMPYCQTIAQGLWLMVLTLCAWAAIRLRRHPAVAVLALTLLGLTLYVLLLEVWPRYLFLYAPFYVILASMAFEKPLCFKR